MTYIWIYLCSSFPLSLSEYNDTEQEKNEDCPQGEYFLQDDTEEMTKKACRFKRGSLSFCSGLSDTNFGYSEGKPCVLLKMNRVTHAFALTYSGSSITNIQFCPFIPDSFDLFFPLCQLLICLCSVPEIKWIIWFISNFGSTHTQSSLYTSFS